jgi:hypothetical protein
MRRTRLFAACTAALLALPVSARALEFTLAVHSNSGYLGSYDETTLGCTPTGTPGVSSCVGGGVDLGDVTMDSWNLLVDDDPVVSGITAVTNNTNAIQQFTLIFTLTTGAIGPQTLVGGSISGSVTDNTNDVATVSAPVGGSIYEAQLDGTGIATLHDDPFSASAFNFLSNPIAGAAFGTPIPSQLEGAVTANIGIRLDFTLTPFDSASFTSNFVVIPIPEPGSFGLVALGLLGVAAIRRR